MSWLFDGFGDLHASLFGANVTITPFEGTASEIDAIFRDGDVPILSDEGPVVHDGIPTLRLPRDLALSLLPDGQVKLSDGRVFKALAPMDPGSPDISGLVTLQLEYMDG